MRGRDTAGTGRHTVEPTRPSTHARAFVVMATNYIDRAGGGTTPEHAGHRRRKNLNSLHIIEIDEVQAGLLLSASQIHASQASSIDEDQRMGRAEPSQVDGSATTGNDSRAHWNRGWDMRGQNAFQELCCRRRSTAFK